MALGELILYGFLALIGLYISVRLVSFAWYRSKKQVQEMDETR